MEHDRAIARTARPAPFRACISIVALLATPGCFRSDGLAPDAPRPGSSGTLVRIAMEPQTTRSSQVFRTGEIRFEEGATPVMGATDAVALALGGAYPLAVEVELTGVYAGRCDGPGGRIEITSVGGGDDALSIRRTSGARYEIRSNGEQSDATMLVRGTFVADTPFSDDGCWREMAGRSELDFELELEVRGREVHGVELDPQGPCEDRVFFAETTLDSIRYHPLDRDGRAFYPANASDERPVDLELSARDGSELMVGADGDLPSVRLPASETIVEVAGPAGPPVELRVVDPARVTELDYTVRLMASPQALEPGDTVDAAEVFGSNRLVVSADGPQTVGGEPICSGVPASRFELTSATPAICRVHEPAAGGDSLGWYGALIGTAELLGDGECRLRWSAPTLDGGRGLGGELSATFLHVEALVPFE